jgi:membrane-associated phospholipid phosphatase
MDMRRDVRQNIAPWRVLKGLWVNILKRVLVAIPVVLMMGSSASAQQAAQTPTQPGRAAGYILEGDYWFNFLKIPYKLVMSPVDWSLGDWGKVALVGAGAAGLMFLDSNLKDFAQDDMRSSTTDSIADWTRPFGDSKVLFPAMAGGYLVGAVTGSRRLTAASLLGLQSLSIAAGMTEGIKLLAGRTRPNMTEDQWDFQGPGGDQKSFVSGHATHAFAVATVFALEYRDSYVVPPLAYSLASLAAYSRVNDNKHWVSDVVLGAGVGFLIGVLTHRLSPFRPGNNPAVSILPMVGEGKQGINIALKF